MRAEDFAKFVPDALEFLARPPTEVVFSPGDRARMLEWMETLAQVRYKRSASPSWEEPPPVETFNGLVIRASDWIADGEPVFLWRDHAGRIDRLERVNFAV